MSAKKILLLTSAILVALLCLGFLGIRTFTQQIVNNRDCEWANIDHIEIRAMVDIPPVLDSYCDYNAGSKRKTTVFTLDKSKFDLAEYSAKYDFKNVKSVPLNFSDLNMGGVASIDASNLFYREGKTETNSYRMLLDANGGKVWVELDYFYED